MLYGEYVSIYPNKVLNSSGFYDLDQVFLKKNNNVYLPPIMIDIKCIV